MIETKATNETSGEGLLTLAEVQARVGRVSRSSIWRWVRDGIFPAPIKLGLRKAVWRASDIERWRAVGPDAWLKGQTR